MSQIELFSLRPLLSFESLLNSKNKDLFNIDNVDDFQILSWTAGGRFDGREFVVIACKSKSQLNANGNFNGNNNNNANNPNSPQAQLGQSLLSQSSNLSANSSPSQQLSDDSQQYLIIRSVNALPQKLRSKYRRRSKRKHAKLVKDSNIQHLYGDIYHIDVDDDDDDDDGKDDEKKEEKKPNKSQDASKSNDDNKENGTEIQSQQSKPKISTNLNHQTKTSGTEYVIDSDDDDSDGIHSVSSIDSEPPDIQQFGKNFAPDKETNINYDEYDELPVLRIITWFKTGISSSFDKTIVSMDFNPSGSWLMVTCRDCSVYLLPLRNFLEIPTHQLELAVTTAYELNNSNNNEDEFFEQQFGFVNQSNDMKRGGMIRSERSNSLDQTGQPMIRNMNNINDMKQDDMNGYNENQSNIEQKPKRSKKSKRGDVSNIGSTSLAHLVLHRGKTNKTKSKKGWGGWFGSRKSSFSGGNAPFTFRASGGRTIGHDTTEQLEDEICADGNESFGPQHDLTILSHGIARTRGDEYSSSKSKKKKKKSKHLKHSLLNVIDENKEICANCSVWWTTRARKDYVLFGTNDGRICLLNVRSHKKTWIEIGNESLNIISLELIIDIKSSSVLIHCSNNIYYILLLERPFKKNREQYNQSLHGALSAQMSQELLMAGYLLNNQQNEDPSKITQWDTIIDNYQINAFHPLQLNLGQDDNMNGSRMSLSKKNDVDVRSQATATTSSSNDVTISLSVYHNTGSVIADPHQQTPTPSEKAARMLGLPYPRRRIVASNNKNPNFQGNGLSSSSLGNINEDPLRTEHAQSCVHFGVFYNKQSKLALHALDEIYQPPRAHFRIQPSLANVFAHNFIISLAPNNQYNQISIIAPPLASLMNPIYDSDDDLDDDEVELDDDEIILSSNSDNDIDDEEEEASIHTVKDSDDRSIQTQRTQDMLSDIDDAEIEANNANDGIRSSALRNLNLKRALLRHHNKKGSSVLQRRLAHGGIVQSLVLDPDERVCAILDRTTSVIMSNPKIYIARLDPLELSQLNKDATHAFDVTITPTMGKSEIPYGATHSVWSSLKSPYLLLLTNKAVYQIDKQFDGFSTVLKSVEQSDQFGSKNVVNGLAACCEVNSKSIHEIAADRMLAHNSKIRDAERSFELYSRSSVTVAKLIRQFLRPEWLHDTKHDIIVSKIFGILKRLLTTADIPSRITFSDIMFNLLLLQYHIHHPFLEYITTKHDTIKLLSYDTQKMIEMLPKDIFIDNKEEIKKQSIDENEDDQEIIEMKSADSSSGNEDDQVSNSYDNSDDDLDKKRESEAQLRRRKLIHFISMNRECSLKLVIRKMLNISQQDLALHVLQSHDHPKSLGANANLPVGDGPAAQVAQAAALAQAQAGISLNVTGNLTDFFLSMTSTLGLNLEPGTASFVIKNYPLLFLERKLDLQCIPSQFWTDIIFNMLDKVVQLCENSNTAQRYYQTQQLFRQRKQQQNFHEEYVKEAAIEDAAKDAEKYGTKEIKPINAPNDKPLVDKESNEPILDDEKKDIEDTKPVPPTQPPPSALNKLPKSFQEETRMRQKQVVQYLADNIKLFSLEQLVTIHSYLTKLTSNILEKLYGKTSGGRERGSISEDYDALSWSTPGWLLLHLKVLLRIRYVNRIKYNEWDKFGNDKHCKEFEYFLDEVLSKFTGMLDITLILDEMLKCNDLPMAMLLHEKLSNHHDYILTYIRFLLQQSYGTIDPSFIDTSEIVTKSVLHTNKEYRDAVLKKIVNKVILMKPSQNKILLGQDGAISHAQGRCLARLIGLWMKLRLPLEQVENQLLDNFDAIKYGLTNVLFRNWSNHQTWYDNDTMPKFSPTLMLRISEFALNIDKY